MLISAGCTRVYRGPPFRPLRASEEQAYSLQRLLQSTDSSPRQRSRAETASAKAVEVRGGINPPGQLSKIQPQKED